LIYNREVKAASFILMGLLLVYGCSQGEEVVEPPAPETSAKLMRDKAAILQVQRAFLDDIAGVGDKWDAYELSLRADLSEYAAGRLDALDEVISTPKGKLIKEKFLELLKKHHETASNWIDTLAGLREVEERLRQFKEEGEGANAGSVEERTARQIELLKEKRDIQGRLTGKEQADIMNIEHEIVELFKTYK
jgi:hypothetical protein